MKASKFNCYITCTKGKRPRTWETIEAKEKPGYAICPVCNEYHKVEYKKEK